MTLRIEEATRDAVRRCLPELLGMDQETPGERWEADHFLLDRPGKWLLSRLALDEQGRAVGFVFASLQEGEVHMHRMVVDEVHRGEGLGTRFVRGVAQAGLSQGSRQMTLKIFPGNVGSLRLFQRLGFRETARGPENVFLVGQLEQVLAELALTGRAEQEGA